MAVTTTWMPARFAAAPRPSGPTFQHLADAAARGCGMGRLQDDRPGGRSGDARGDLGRQYASRRDIRPRPVVRGRRCEGRRTGRSRSCRWATSSHAFGATAYSMVRCCCTAMAALLAAAFAQAARASRRRSGFPSVYRIGLPALRRTAPRRARGCGSRARRSVLCSHRVRRRHQSAASRRPRRASLCASRDTSLPRRGRRAQVRLARARAIGSTKTSSPGVSAPAGRPISLR